MQYSSPRQVNSLWQQSKYAKSSLWQPSKQQFRVIYFKSIYITIIIGIGRLKPGPIQMLLIDRAPKVGSSILIVVRHARLVETNREMSERGRARVTLPWTVRVLLAVRVSENCFILRKRSKQTTKGRNEVVSTIFTY